MKQLTHALLMLAVAAIPAAAQDNAEENLVANPGFEAAGDTGRPSAWNGAADVFRRDIETKRTGEASLRYDNADAACYVLCSQPIDLKPGVMYEIRAWVKTASVTGSDSGATICVEWDDDKGQYLGGHYPAGVKGDSDWTEVRGVTPRIPENARGPRILCYLRKGMTGTAWWDDVSVRRIRETPLSCVLMQPNYRGRIADNGPENIRIRAMLRLDDYGKTPKDLTLRWRIARQEDDTPATEGVEESLAETAIDLVLPGRSLEPGRYGIVVGLIDKASQATLAECRMSANRVPGSAIPKTYIDERNRFIVEGKPFFPLGMYWGQIAKEELDIYADSPFNCLMPYGAPSTEQMDWANERGLKIIYTVKDACFGSQYCIAEVKSKDDEYPFIKSKVETFRNHPALLAWYINDELPLDMIEQLTVHRQWIEDLDPDHPAWVVLYQADQIRDYLPSFDAIGTDPYPIPARAPSLAGDWTRRTVDGVCGSRAVWQVPQVFNWANYHEDERATSRAPTFEEMRSMAWQCIVNGATGLVFYSWFDLRRDSSTPFDEQWAKVKDMAREIKDRIPILLSVEPAPEIATEAVPEIRNIVRQCEGKTYLIAVNESADEKTLACRLPSAPKQVLDSKANTLACVADNRLDIPLAGWDVAILEIAW